MKFNFGNALTTALIATAWLAPAAFAQIQKFENDKGDYLVTTELATALKNAPDGKALIRLSIKQDANQQFTTEIGEKTVAAWKVIYH
jgi:hypothetical protein